MSNLLEIVLPNVDGHTACLTGRAQRQVRVRNSNVAVVAGREAGKILSVTQSGGTPVPTSRVRELTELGEIRRPALRKGPERFARLGRLQPHREHFALRFHLL